MIDPLAVHLNIPVPANIRANTLLFDKNGEYENFDPTEPTSRSGGKAKALMEIREKGGYETMVMVGDGATDMEAKLPGQGADLTVGFGGIIVRQNVKDVDDWFVHSFDELIEHT